ncbi:DUF1365 domain-containing protein [Vibrio sp. SCSIO 43136]|uniref:DUF1365 domain-containing protein n=1 Tax=Vibrio sp. SCSIO 43136 TaxID=2819101 RepID=UPI002074CB90|nr:DUF1365 domain-containing protein [Vibrio sp. SCSIO 43136]USD64367.1 DUF1365 domain-containing protein [Vibrio sp. SCSIO 43136]
MNSCIMSGDVFHQRFVPIKHKINYRLFMPLLDLDEIESLQKQWVGFGQRWWHWARFRRADYLGKTGSLKLALQDKLFELTGERLTGKVLALCHLRYFGLYFSPVNFYYLYDHHDQFKYLIAEVSNTPWNERHYYAVNADKGVDDCNWIHPKQFHVSPFNPMEQKYRWHFAEPSEQLTLKLDVIAQGKEFTAGVAFTKQPITRFSMMKQLTSTPVMSLKILAGIYAHALRLWWKGAPIYDHPARKEQSYVQK